MNTFRSNFIFEFKRSPGKIFCAIALMIMTFSLVFIQNGTDNYKQAQDRNIKFQEIEKVKVSKYINYRQYGIYGLRLLFLKSSFAVFFFQSTVFPEIAAHIDSSERLKIYLMLKGKNPFELKGFLYMDFSGVILFFGSLLAMFYGRDAFNNKEFLQLRASCAHRKSLYFSILAARLIKMNLFFLFVLSCVLLMIFINGVIIPYNKYLLHFTWLITLNTVFFFVLGSVFGNVKSKVMGTVIILGCWFTLLFFVPITIKSYISKKSGNIQPIYDLEMKKLNVYSEFEKQSKKNNITYKDGEKLTDTVKNRVLIYWNNEFNKIHLMEKQMLEQMKNNVTAFFKISMFTPTTLYLSSAGELSSGGYKSLLDFYSFVIDKKKDFVKFYIEKLFFSNFSKVVPFDDGKGNVFSSTCHLAGYYTQGMLVNHFYIFLLIIISYICFRISIIRLPAATEKMKNENNGITLNNGDFKIWTIYSDMFKNQLYTLFSGEDKELKKKGYTRHLIINGKDWIPGKGGMDFLYLCHPEHIPGNIRVCDFIDLTARLLKAGKKEKENIIKRMGIDTILSKRFNKLSPGQTGDILVAMTYLKRKKVYLVNDIGRNLPVDFHIRLKDRLEELSKSGAVVLFLISNPLLIDTSMQTDADFFEDETWATLVDNYKNHKKTVRG